MSGPISATITSAAVAPRPAIVRRRAAAAANGAIAAAIRSSSRAPRSSVCSIRSSSSRSRERWCSPTRPASACFSRGALPRSRSRASSASARGLPAGDQRPDHGAARDPEPVAGGAGRLDVGLLRHLRHPVDDRDAVVDRLRPLPRQARRARTSGGGTKPGASRPCASSRAIHAAPLTSVLPPGTCLMGRALTSSGAKRSPSRCRSAPSKRRSIPSRHGGPPRPRANRPEPAARRSWCRRCGPGSAPGHRGRRGGCRRRRSPCGRPVRHRSGGSGPSGWLRGDIGSAMVSAPGRPRRIEPFALRAPRVVRGRRGRVRRGVGRGRGPVRLRAEAPKRRRPCPGPSPSGIDPMRSIFMGSGAPPGGHDRSFREWRPRSDGRRLPGERSG